jgi:hypothetical protein
MIKFIDKIIVWAMYVGIFLLATTLCDKDITTRGPIGSSISLVVGAVAVYFSKPLFSRFARYQLVIIIILVWWGTIYLTVN